MKRAIVLLVVCWSGLVMLQGCSLPLVGSITGNSLTAAVTGNYERSLVNGGIDLIVHKKTGKTTSQHLYQVAETRWTKDKLEKHFPDKKITIKDFNLGYSNNNNSTQPIIDPTQASDRQDLINIPPFITSAKHIKARLYSARVSSKYLLR